MKAKQYAQQFIENVPDIMDTEKRNAEIKALCKGFWNDFDNLKTERKVTTDQGFIPIFKELDQKWNSVRIRLKKHYGVNVIINNGFKILLKQSAPLAYKFYMDSV